VLLCTIFFTTQAGILTDEDTGPEGENPEIIKLKMPFKVIKTRCKTKAVKGQAAVNENGANVGYSSSQVNYKFDCTSGSMLSCQIINCEGKTLKILIHEN